MSRKPSRRVAIIPQSALARGLRAVVLLLPSTMLFGAALRVDDAANLMLWLGTTFLLLVCLLDSVSRQGVRQPVGPSVVTLYVIGLGWLWLGAPQSKDWFVHLGKAILLIVPLLCFSIQLLTESGAPALRRARFLANSLSTRQEWPAELDSCRILPEVKALRDAITRDATPALALLADPRPQVQVAALAALEFRKEWRPGQTEILLMIAQRAREPVVRATAVLALGNVDDRATVEALAEFLRDPSSEVRRAAAEACLWNTAQRWIWVAQAVRRSLADPTCADDGPLRHEGQMLSPEAVSDLLAWSAQKGLVAQRSALTLAQHYARALAESPSDELFGEMRRQLADPHTPAVLRMELGRLLQEGRLGLDRDLLENLLASANPAPLRLLAAESLLSGEGTHREAVNTLQHLARLPNREIALATAEVVQRRLGVDLGLPHGEPLPPPYSRQAAEVARRILAWAAQCDRRGQSALREVERAGH